ncbi:hypothetical protein EBR03_03100 [bacterium]|nr:hypothetical protein [bacterium]
MGCRTFWIWGYLLKTLKLITIFSLCLLLQVSSLFAAETAAPVVKVTEAPVVTTANGVKVETRTIETQGSSQAKPQAQAEPVATKIENYITIDTREPAMGAIPAAAAPAVVSAVANEATSASNSLKITPVAGITAYQGAWYSHIANRGTVGLILDIPLISILSLEVEGQYGRFNISYSGYGRPFTQYSGGANAKVTLKRGFIQPYVGAGMMAVRYEGLAMADNYFSNQPSVMAAGQLVAGAEMNLLAGVSVGARGEWLSPLPRRNGQLQPNYNVQSSEVSAMMSNFYRILGTVSVSF